MSKKVVLITGTNSGFGWLAAKSVAALGHKVYATIRDTEGKNADKAKALAMPTRCRIPLDMSAAFLCSASTKPTRVK